MPLHSYGPEVPIATHAAPTLEPVSCPDTSADDILADLLKRKLRKNIKNILN